MGCAALGGGYFLISGNIFFAVFFLFHGFQNVQVYRAEFLRRKKSDFSHHEGLAALKNEEGEKAEEIFRKLLKTKDGFIKTAATEGLAEILEAQGNRKEAYHLLLKADPLHLKKGKWLLCKLAFKEGNYSLIDLLERALRHQP